MTAAVLIYVLSIGAVALFNYGFFVWNVPLYGVASALLIFCAAAFGFVLAKSGKRSEKVIAKTAVTAVVFSALYFGIVFLVNNVILQAKHSDISTPIATAMLLIFFAVCFVIAVKRKGGRVLPAALSVILAAAVGFSPTMTRAFGERKINSSERKASPMNLSVYEPSERKICDNADFYVSPSGSDENDGSFSSPFATIEKARDEVRKLDKTGKNGVTVAVMAGEYRVSSLVFGVEDAGTADCRIAYRAYGDGEVVLNGGVTIGSDSFVRPDDEEVLSRLTDDAARNVMCADLKEYGLTSDDWGRIYAIGSYNTAAKYDGDYVGGLYCELFVNDRRQVLARYPDDGEYLYTEKVISTGCGRESDGALTAVENWDDIRNPAPDVYGISKELAGRIASWKTTQDVWMFGFWKYDWADASSPIGEFNEENRTLSPKFVSTYGTKTDAPYYFFNVFEELSAPGEWYLDRENGIVYVYPDTDLAGATVDLSVSSDNIIAVDGADHLTFDGLTVKGTRGDAISVKANGVIIENCLVKNVAGNAMIIEGYDNLVLENEITRTGKAGIFLNGGDRENLVPGNNRADNNLIHDWSEIYQTYQPAVSLNGVGNVCSHNEIYNSPHEAITFAGNDHIIEYNNIHDVCLLTDDGGAIYSGRRWDFYGNVIRFNAVYDLGSGDHIPDGIYMDDALSGQTIYGNILVNVPKIGIHLGGGRDMTVRNNLIINTNRKSISYDDRAIQGVFGGWFTHSSSADGDMWQNLFNSPWQNDIWKNAYPQMQKFSDDFENTDDPDFVPNPAYSDVSGNIIVNLTGEIGSISDAAKKYSDTENNLIYKESEGKKLFADAENGDYTLVDPPEYFENIPFSEIGRYPSKGEYFPVSRGDIPQEETGAPAALS